MMPTLPVADTTAAIIVAAAGFGALAGHWAICWYRNADTRQIVRDMETHQRFLEALRQMQRGQ